MKTDIQRKGGFQPPLLKTSRLIKKLLGTFFRLLRVTLSVAPISEQWTFDKPCAEFGKSGKHIGDLNSIETNAIHHHVEIIDYFNRESMQNYQETHHWCRVRKKPVAVPDDFDLVMVCFEKHVWALQGGSQCSSWTNNKLADVIVTIRKLIPSSRSIIKLEYISRILKFF